MSGDSANNDGNDGDDHGVQWSSYLATALSVMIYGNDGHDHGVVLISGHSTTYL